jgi:thioredoxin reductase (NADPH)
MVALIEGERLAMNDDRNQDRLQDNQSACKGPGGHFQSIHQTFSPSICECNAAADENAIGSQAAVFLAETVRMVYMLVRGKELSETTSRYLIRQIAENPGIELHFQAEIVALAGDSHLDWVTWLN